MYVQIIRIIISSYDDACDKSVSSELAYTSQSYSEAMVMSPAVTYTTYGTSSREQTSNLMTFAQFEEGGLLTETRNNTESSDESDSESIMMSERIRHHFLYRYEFPLIFSPPQTVQT